MSEIFNQYRLKGNVSPDTLKGGSYDDLMALKNLVESDVTRIANQLSEAKANLIINGERADPGWFHRANSAKRLKGRLCQRIQQELSLKKQKNKEEKTKRLANNAFRAILIAMDRILDLETKEKVLAEWRNIYSE